TLEGAGPGIAGPAAEHLLDATVRLCRLVELERQQVWAIGGRAEGVPELGLERAKAQVAAVRAAVDAAAGQATPKPRATGLRPLAARRLFGNQEPHPAQRAIGHRDVEMAARRPVGNGQER